MIDWSLIGPISLGVMQLIALIGAYYGLKADNAKLASDFALAILTERTDRLAAVVTATRDLTALLTVGDGYIRDLTTRVKDLESGHSEWTKSLRDRTHELSNTMQTLALKVARLEHVDTKGPS